MKINFFNTVNWILILACIAFLGFHAARGARVVLAEPIQETELAPRPESEILDRMEAIQVVLGDVEFPILLAAFKYGRLYDIKPELLLAMAQVESTLRPEQKNKGCLGLYQVRYSIWRRVLQLDRSRMLEVDYNTWAAARILRIYIDQADGDVWRAVHLYNNGPSGKYNNLNYIPKVQAIYDRMTAQPAEEK